MIEFRPLKDLKLVPPSPDRHWLVQGVLPASVVAEVYGPPMSGKTTLCSALAVAVNTGSKLLDATVPHRFGKVVYVTSDGYSAHAAMTGVLSGLGHSDTGDILVVPITSEAEFGRELVRELVDKVLNQNPRPALVVDDCTILEVAARESADTRQVMLHELQRLIRVGVSVLIAHTDVDWLGCQVKLYTSYDSAQNELNVYTPYPNERLVLRAAVHHGEGAVRFTAKPIPEAPDVSPAP